jgi:MYXO-CTERM domain-containing protein
VWRSGSPNATCKGTTPDAVRGDWSFAYDKLENLRTGVTIAAPFQSVIPAQDGFLRGTALTATGDLLGRVQQPPGTMPRSIIYRYRAGSITQLAASNSDSSGWGVATDGVEVILDVLDVGPVDHFVRLVNGVEERITGPDGGAIVGPVQNNGWIAYLTSTDGLPEVWVRAPDGTKTQHSNLNIAADSRAPWSAAKPGQGYELSSRGELMFTAGGTRYMRHPPAPPETINTDLGRAIPRCDGWYVVMGNTLFQVSGTEDAGSNCDLVDAGAPDATLPGDDAAVPSNADAGGSDAGTSGDLGGGGCDGGCAIGSPIMQTGGPLAALAVGLAAMLRRRRRG